MSVEEEELIIKAHIQEGLTPIKIKEKYNLVYSEYQIRAFLKKENIYKQKNVYIDVEKLLKNIDKETFINYYNEHSWQKTMDHFGLSYNAFTKIKKVFGFKKNKSNALKIRKETCQQKYGVDNPFKSEIIKEKIKNTCLEKYGVEHAIQNPDIQKKVQDTWKNNWGDDYKNILINKRVEANIQKHGVRGYNNRDKYKETLSKNYGTEENAYKTFYEKSKNSCLEKYGVDNPLKNETIKEKVKNTCLEKYGACSPFESEEILNKCKQTLFNKYGVTNPAQISAIKNKIKEKISNLQKEKHLLEGCSEFFWSLYHNQDESKKFLEKHSPATYDEWSKFFNCGKNTIIMWINKFNLNSYVKHEKSKYEDEIIDYIGRDLVVHNDRKTLNGSEIDIFVPSLNLGIEFNGNYYHCSLNKPKNYHFEKSKLAESQGVRLIHIYEYEWVNPEMQAKIKQLLDIALGRVKEKIYARQCIIKQITNREAQILNEEVHLQGHRNAQVTYGLFYKNRLVQLMSFSKTKYNKNLKNKNSWEIIRGCPGSNNIVIGGVSKLFKHFIKEYQPSEIFSYCDFNKFNGKSYEKIGMRFVGYTGPDKKWLLKEGSVVNRNPKKYSELKQIAKAEIWGAGSKKYLWVCAKTNDGDYQ